MTFDEILAQVLELLKRQGRVSYRALKMRFDLDDEYLDVLKEELIDAQHIATDEDGRILVWAGESGGAPVSSSPSMQAEPQAPQQHDQLTPHTPDAERRHRASAFGLRCQDL